jgi:peptidoglycan/xylan/chitin deacetylase (PgdA/CDA1 family)
MKAIMYHYVRQASGELPYFRYLHVDDFARQLDWFAENFRFVTRYEFDKACQTGEVPKGIILTFDDGLVDHHQFVFPLLKDRNLFGIFYICSVPLERRKLLDVHRIHLILGRLGGEAAMQRLQRHLSDDMLEDAHRTEFREATYRNQANDDATTTFKRILNYWISYEHREAILNTLFEEEFGTEAAAVEEFYLSPAQIREMDASGMVVGSHGANHLLFSKLSAEGQRAEITASFECLSRILGKPVTTFCYPYGGSYAFTPYTVSLLERAGTLFSFDVNPRDITAEDLRSGRQALPRYDCNMFPHGKASLGAARPRASRGPH